jgi:hypothetical protein
MIKQPKQKKQLVLLSVLLIALVVVLYYALSGGTDSDLRGSSAKKMSQANSAADIKDLVISRNPRRTGGKKEVPLREVDPTIHLERLAQFDPGTPLNARNMFSLDAPPAPREPVEHPPRHAGISGPGAGSAANSGLAMGNSRAPQPPAVNINLKFIGFALNPDQKTRQGFFAEGDEVYLALEGQLVANRYRVVHISDASAEIEEVTSKTRRQISLVTQ